MDLIATEVKESPGLCRCCLSEGCYKDLTADYPWMSETEVYSDMLLQCFGILLSQQPEGPDGATNLICEVCITRLRDASHFKKQVQDSERTFVNMMLASGEIACVENQEITNVDAEDLKVTALQEPEFAEDNVASNEMDPLIKQEAVKEEDNEDLQEAACEDLQLSDEDDGASFRDVSRDASLPALGAGCDWSRVFGCRVKVRDARDELLCSQCGEWSLTAARLQRHRQTHATPVHAATYVCHVCGKTYIRKDNLMFHIRVHSGVKPYLCNVCGKKFTHASNLHKHVKRHSGVKPFSCNVCANKFTCRSGLKRHLELHCSVKPYSCDICDKMFTAKNDLKRHIDTHNGVKGFSCKICNHSFQWLGNLKRHLLTNCKLKSLTDSKMKSFTCDICDKMFTSKKNLRCHIDTHIGVKRFSCKICNHSFQWLGKLKRHLLTYG